MEPHVAIVGNNCKFCEIANNQTDTEVLMSDCEMVCFCDLKPGDTHHYLIISKTRIDNCMKLQADHIKLVGEKMKDMGMRMLQMNKMSDLDDSGRMGFHGSSQSNPQWMVHGQIHKSMHHYGPQSHWFITLSIQPLQVKGPTRAK
uniref:HIT domain-containing protein n=1 Tax=Periophthalmus magnuspinnatus TaxID=409849 RepID=A0A3B4AXY9_9GOBI